MTTAIILAGGLGSRLRSVVLDVPKPMAPISNRPFLEYLLDYWIAQGINDFVISVGYRGEVITQHFGNSYKNVNIEYVIEENPLGTGGGLLLALKKVDQTTPFILLNGDTYFEVNLKALMDFSNEKDADWCFSLFKVDNNSRYMGMEVDEEGRVLSLKSKESALTYLINGGVYLVKPQKLIDMGFTIGKKKSLEEEIFPNVLAADQRIYGKVFTGTFIDIGIPDDFFRAGSLLSE